MTMQKSDYIWFNGEFVPWDDAKIHVMSHVLHYGSSVFEGIRAYSTPKGPAIFRLDTHVHRLFTSTKIARMPIPFTETEIAQGILDTVAKNRHQACYIRPLVFRGYDAIGVDPRSCPVEVIVATIEWGRYLGAEAIEQGVDVGVSSWRRMAPDTFTSMAKIGGQYINSQFVSIEAKRHGYTEGIALDIYGYVSEGSGENIFLVQDGVLFTPPLGNSILAGITRQCVMTLANELGHEVREHIIPREWLYIADELFFTGTAAEISPIRSVDGMPVGAGKRGPITQALQEQFFGITSGELEDRHGWLTLVTAEG